MDVFAAHGACLGVCRLVLEKVLFKHVLRHPDQLLSGLFGPLFDVFEVCDLLVDLPLLLVLLLSLPVLLSLLSVLVNLLCEHPSPEGSS